MVVVVGADAASEEEQLEVEYLLLALDFGEILLLFAAFWPLQAALLQVFEAGGHSGALGRPWRVTAVLWEPGDTRELSAKSKKHLTYWQNHNGCFHLLKEPTLDMYSELKPSAFIDVQVRCAQGVFYKQSVRIARSQDNPGSLVCILIKL